MTKSRPHIISALGRRIDTAFQVLTESKVQLFQCTTPESSVPKRAWVVDLTGEVERHKNGGTWTQHEDEFWPVKVGRYVCLWHWGLCRVDT